MTRSHSPRRLLLSTPLTVVLLLSVSVGVATCGGEAPDEARSDRAEEVSGSDGLTEVELEQGIGPFRDLVLSPIDAEMVATGEELYTANCSACHRLEDRLVGPRLGTVLARRRPEFVLNMIVNSEEMLERHPVVKELFAQFFTPMLTQVRDEGDARAILEYLRSVQIDSIGSGDR